MRSCDKVGDVGAVGEMGQEIFVEKNFESVEKAMSFKKSYEKSSYEKEKVFVKLMHSTVVSSDASAKKKPVRPKNSEEVTKKMFWSLF